MSNVITENKEKQCHESYNTRVIFRQKLQGYFRTKTTPDFGFTDKKKWDVMFPLCRME